MSQEDSDPSSVGGEGRGERGSRQVQREGVDVATSLGYLLKQTSAALRAAMEEALRPLGMSVTRYSCMELLSQRPGSSNSDLARGTFVTRQSMNVLLQSLEKEGLVTRAVEAPAGRALPAQLTAQGQRELARASAAVRAVEMAMLAHLSEAQQVATRQSLRSMIGALEAWRGGSDPVGG